MGRPADTLRAGPHIGIAGIAGIAGIVQAYADAARLAGEQGSFNLLEVHGANGYVPHQFLAEGTNSRTDQYGGNAENRASFLVEVTTAVAAAVGG